MELLVYILAAFCLALLVTVVHLMQIKFPKPTGTLEVVYDKDAMEVLGLYLEFEDRSNIDDVLYRDFVTFKVERHDDSSQKIQLL